MVRERSEVRFFSWAPPACTFPDSHNPVFRLILPAAVSLLLSGCMLFTVADAAVTVVATTVKVGATVVGTTVDVAAAGVKAVAGTDDKKKEKD